MTDPSPDIAAIRELIDDEDFEEALERVEASDADAVALARLKAEALLGLEEIEEALDFVEETLEGLGEDAQDPELCAVLGVCLYYVDELEESRQTLNTALRLDPANITALHARAMVLRDLDFVRASDLDLDKALALLEGDEAQAEMLAETWSIKAGFALDGDDLVGAEAALKKAANAAPDSSEYTLELARLYAVINRPADAIARAKQAAEVDEWLIEARLLVSHLLYLQGDMDAAVANTEAALEVDDEEPYTLVQLGSFALYGEDYEAALDYADRTIDLDPDVVDAYQIKAAALRALGRDEEVVGDVADLETSTPDLPSFIFGDRIDPAELAADALEQAAEMDPEQLRAIVDQLFESGQIPEAMRPMINMTLENLPNILEAIPAMTGMSPEELFAQMQTNPSLAGPSDLTLGEPDED